MFGLFKKKRKAEEAKQRAGFLLLQSGMLPEPEHILTCINEKNRQPGRPDTGTDPALLCGQWYNRELGICLKINRQGEGYTARLWDTGDPIRATGVSYPMRVYRELCYFTLDSYAVFIEYDRQENAIRLCGKLSLWAEPAGSPSACSVFNPN